jgi:hypothetical protein
LEEQEDSPIANDDFKYDFGQKTGLRLYKTETQDEEDRRAEEIF